MVFLLRLQLNDLTPQQFPPSLCSHPYTLTILHSLSSLDQIPFYFPPNEDMFALSFSRGTWIKPCNPKYAGRKCIPEVVLAFDEIDTPNLKPLWALDDCQTPGCITETLQARALSKHFIILLHT